MLPLRLMFCTVRCNLFTFAAKSFRPWISYQTQCKYSCITWLQTCAVSLQSTSDWNYKSIPAHYQLNILYPYIILCYLCNMCIGPNIDLSPLSLYIPQHVLFPYIRVLVVVLRPVLVDSLVMVPLDNASHVSGARHIDNNYRGTVPLGACGVHNIYTICAASNVYPVFHNFMVWFCVHVSTCHF